jgi:hypothetical protein
LALASYLSHHAIELTSNIGEYLLLAAVCWDQLSRCLESNPRTSSGKYSGRLELPPRILLVANYTCSVIFCEAVAIYGVIIAIILLTKADGLDKDLTDNKTQDKVIFSFLLTSGLGPVLGLRDLRCWTLSGSV